MDILDMYIKNKPEVGLPARLKELDETIEALLRVYMDGNMTHRMYHMYIMQVQNEKFRLMAEMGKGEQ